MRNQKIEKMLLYIFLLAFFTVLGTNYLNEKGQYYARQQKTVDDPEFRRDFFSDSMRAVSYTHLTLPTILRV